MARRLAELAGALPPGLSAYAAVRAAPELLVAKLEPGRLEQARASIERLLPGVDVRRILMSAPGALARTDEQLERAVAALPEDPAAAARTAELDPARLLADA